MQTPSTVHNSATLPVLQRTRSYTHLTILRACPITIPHNNNKNTNNQQNTQKKHASKHCAQQLCHQIESNMKTYRHLYNVHSPLYSKSAKCIQNHNEPQSRPKHLSSSNVWSPAEYILDHDDYLLVNDPNDTSFMNTCQFFDDASW